MTATQAVARYASVARPVILEFFPPNSCIAASRITIEVLRRFGVKAQAIPVSMIVEAKAHSLAFVTGGLDLKAMAHEVLPSENPWPGHCVVVAAGHLIDPTFDQCNMADRGIRIPPYILTVRIGDSIKPSNIAADLELVTGDGEILNVRYFPLADWSFLSAPAWETDHLEPAIRKITKLMEPLK